MGGGPFRGPIGQDNTGGGSDPLRAAAFLTHVQGAKQDRALRARLAESLIQERQDKDALAQESRAKALFTQGVEAASGLKPAEQSEAMPYFAEAQRLSRPEAATEPSLGTLPSGNLIERPYMGQEAKQAALRQGAGRLREATAAAGAALPPDDQSKFVQGQIARGEIRVPSAVIGAREKAIKTETDAQKLRQATREEDFVVSQKREQASLTAAQAKHAEVANIYQVPIIEAEQAHRKATTATAQAEERKVRGEMGEIPLVPGSPQAIKADEAKADLENKRITAQEAKQRFAQHTSYIQAMARYRETGKVEDLNRALTYSSNGAMDLSNLALRGEEQDLNRVKFIATETDKMMEKQPLLQERANKKDFAAAEGLSRQINQHALAIATIGRSPTVPWESVRQEEGKWPLTGSIVRSTITLSREEALALQNDMVRPDSTTIGPGDDKPAVGKGLTLLLSARFGDLVHRAGAKDQAAIDMLINKAETYPGVTREASDAVVAMLRKQGAQPAISGMQAPQVSETNVPREFQDIERQDAIKAAEAEAAQKRGNVFTKWLALEAQKVGKLPTQLTDQEIAALRKRFDSTLRAPAVAR